MIVQVLKLCLCLSTPRKSAEITDASYHVLLYWEFEVKFSCLSTSNSPTEPSLQPAQALLKSNVLNRFTYKNKYSLSLCGRQNSKMLFIESNPYRVPLRVTRTLSLVLISAICPKEWGITMSVLVSREKNSPNLEGASDVGGRTGQGAKVAENHTVTAGWWPARETEFHY